MENGLILEYTLHPDGAHLVRALGETPCPALPDTLGGLPLVQIGDYAFSASQHKVLPKGEVHTAQIGTPPPAPQPLCGNFLQAVRLPQPLQVLGNAAFYNCRKLEQLSFGPQVRSVGSDLFTNCHQLTRFVLRAAPEAPTGLPPLLGALQTDLRLTFAPNGTVLAALRYPEYWEELEENAPAHIFNRGIHGQGYRYRQCFTRGVVDYTAYDRTFEVALAEEDPTMLAELAFDRLRWPVALTEEAREQYTAYLAGHADLAAGRLIREEDDEGLQLLCSLSVFTVESLAQARQLAQQLEKPRAAALLLAHQRAAFAPKKKHYSFD